MLLILASLLSFFPHKVYCTVLRSQLVEFLCSCNTLYLLRLISLNARLCRLNNRNLFPTVTELEGFVMHLEFRTLTNEFYRTDSVLKYSFL